MQGKHGTKAPSGSQDATAVDGKERTAEVTKIGPADKTQMRRRPQRKAPSGSQDATPIGGKEGPVEVTQTEPADKTQMQRRHRTKAVGGSQDATAIAFPRLLDNISSGFSDEKSLEPLPFDARNATIGVFL
jgi:hypothetical protein